MVGLSHEEIRAFRDTPAWHAALGNAHTLLPELESFQRYSFDLSELQGLAVPTLVLRGTESPPFLRDEAEAVAQALPNVVIRELEGQGHEAVQEAPDVFLAAVAPFLTEHNDPVGGGS